MEKIIVNAANLEEKCEILRCLISEFLPKLHLDSTAPLSVLYFVQTELAAHRLAFYLRRVYLESALQCRIFWSSNHSPSEQNTCVTSSVTPTTANTTTPQSCFTFLTSSAFSDWRAAPLRIAFLPVSASARVLEWLLHHPGHIAAVVLDGLDLLDDAIFTTTVIRQSQPNENSNIDQKDDQQFDHKDDDQTYQQSIATIWKRFVAMHALLHHHRLVASSLEECAPTNQSRVWRLFGVVHGAFSHQHGANSQTKLVKALRSFASVLNCDWLLRLPALRAHLSLPPSNLSHMMQCGALHSLQLINHASQLEAAKQFPRGFSDLSSYRDQIRKLLEQQQNHHDDNSAIDKQRTLARFLELCCCVLNELGPIACHLAISEFKTKCNNDNGDVTNIVPILVGEALRFFQEDFAKWRAKHTHGTQCLFTNTVSDKVRRLAQHLIAHLTPKQSNHSEDGDTATSTTAVCQQKVAVVIVPDDDLMLMTMTSQIEDDNADAAMNSETNNEAKRTKKGGEKRNDWLCLRLLSQLIERIIAEHHDGIISSSSTATIAASTTIPSIKVIQLDDASSSPESLPSFLPENDAEFNSSASSASLVFIVGIRALHRVSTLYCDYIVLFSMPTQFSEFAYIMKFAGSFMRRNQFFISSSSTTSSSVLRNANCDSAQQLFVMACQSDPQSQNSERPNANTTVNRQQELQEVQHRISVFSQHKQFLDSALDEFEKQQKIRGGVSELRSICVDPQREICITEESARNYISSFVAKYNRASDMDCKEEYEMDCSVAFRATLIMPESCSFISERIETARILGNIECSKSKAKQSAAFAACKILLEYKLFDAELLIVMETAQLHNIARDSNLESNIHPQNSNSSSTIQCFERIQLSKQLTDPYQNAPNSSCYVYSFEMEPNPIGHLNVSDTDLSTNHLHHRTHEQLVLILSQPIVVGEQNSDNLVVRFPLFTDSGQITVSVRCIAQYKELSTNQMALLYKMHSKLMGNMITEYYNESNMKKFQPMTTSNDHSNGIDINANKEENDPIKFASFFSQSIDSVTASAADLECVLMFPGLVGVFNMKQQNFDWQSIKATTCLHSCSSEGVIKSNNHDNPLVGRVIRPTHSQKELGSFYVRRIASDRNGNSLFGSKNQTVISYFVNNYQAGHQLSNENVNLPLIQCLRLVRPKNALIPHRKKCKVMMNNSTTIDSCSSQTSPELVEREGQKSVEHKNKAQTEYEYMPSLTRVIPFSLSVWTQLQLFPFALNRLNQFLLVREFFELQLANLFAVESEYNPTRQHFCAKLSDSKDFLLKSLANSNKMADYVMDTTLSPHITELDADDLLSILSTLHCHDIVNLERLEMLGDSFLKFSVSQNLFRKHYKRGNASSSNQNDQQQSVKPIHITEQQLTEARSRRISNRNLFLLATGPKLRVHRYLQNRHFQISEHFIAPNAILEIPRRSPTENFATTETMNKNKELFGYYFVEKNMADCVEALIGCCLVRGGREFAEHLLQSLNLIRKKSSKSSTNELYLECENENIQTVEQMQQRHPIEAIIGYEFRDSNLIRKALTQSAAPVENYEILEFIGDAVIDYVITREIFQCKRKFNPGELTTLREALVNNLTFAALVVHYDMHLHLKISSSDSAENLGFEMKEVLKNGRSFLENLRNISSNLIEFNDKKHLKVLGDIFESISGAVFVDSDFDLEVVWQVLEPIFRDIIENYSQDIPKNSIRLLYEKYGNLDLNDISAVDGNINDFQMTVKLKRRKKNVQNGAILETRGSNKELCRIRMYKKLEEHFAMT